MNAEALIPLLLCSGPGKGLAPLVFLWMLSGAKAEGGMMTLGAKRKRKARARKVLVPKKALRRLKAKAKVRRAGPPPASRTPTPDAEPNAAPADEAPLDEIEDVPPQGGPEEIPFEAEEGGEGGEGADE